MCRLLLLLLAAGLGVSHGQARVWARAYGGMLCDGAKSVCRTDDAGYVLAGETRSLGASNYDFLVVRLDAQGDTVWARRLGTQSFDGAHSVCRTADGGYVAAGRTYVIGGTQNDFSVTKLGSEGDFSWARVIGGTGWDEAVSVAPTLDSGFVVAGRTWSYGAGDYDLLLVKLDAEGNLVWARSYGGRYEDYGHAVLPTDDGGYILAGSTWSPGAVSLDMLIIRLDSNDDTLWSRNIGPAGIGGNELHAASLTADGGCIAAGRMVTLGTDNDCVVVKLNAAGGLEWARTFGEDGYECAKAIIQTPDRGYVVAGLSSSFGGDSTDFLIIRLTESGDLSWAGVFGDAGNDSACCILSGSDVLVAAGYTNSWGAGDYDFLAIAVDASGTMSGCPWWRPVSLTVRSPNLPTGTQTLTVETAPVAVGVPAMVEANVILTVTNIWPLVEVEEKRDVSFERWPRTGTVEVCDLTGRAIRTLELPEKAGSLTAGLAAGVYFCRLTGTDFRTAKLVVLR